MRWRELDTAERLELEDGIRLLALRYSDKVVAEGVPTRPYDGSPEVRAEGLLAVIHAATAVRAAVDAVLAQAAWEAGQTGVVGYPELGDAAGITRQTARERWPDALPADRRPGRRPTASRPSAEA